MHEVQSQTPQKESKQVDRIQSSASMLNANLKHAQRLLEDKQEKITGSHDIISRILMPFVYEDELAQYEKLYGEETFTKYIKHHNKAGIVREKILNKIQFYGFTLSMLIIAQHGVGECDEQATYCFVRSHALDYSKIARLEMNMGISTEGKSYAHAFLLVGVNRDDLNQLGNQLKDLSHLPDHIVLLDPLINCICQANQWKESLFDEYTKKYQSEFKSKVKIRKTCVYGSDSLVNLAVQLLAQSKQIYDKEYKPSIVSDEKSSEHSTHKALNDPYKKQSFNYGSLFTPSVKSKEQIKYKHAKTKFNTLFKQATEFVTGGELDSAQKIFDQAIIMLEEIKLENLTTQYKAILYSDLASCYRDLGDIYLSLNEVDEAKTYTQKGLDYCRHSKALNHTSKIDRKEQQCLEQLDKISVLDHTALECRI